MKKGSGEGASWLWGGGGRPEISPPRSFLKVGAYALTERLPSSLLTPFSLRLSRVMLLVQLRGFGGFLCIGTFSVFLAITIDQPRPKFHYVKQLYTPNLAYCSQSTPLP